ncbi:MAG: hypothetical protein ACRDHY_11635 [Anaerolineales bacterium]
MLLKLLGLTASFVIVVVGVVARDGVTPDAPSPADTPAADPSQAPASTATPLAHDHGGSCNAAVPLGALPPAVPAWCNLPLKQGAPTFASTGNSWLDDFDHGLANAELGAGYRAFDRQGASVQDSIHFRHNNHWMVDVRAGEEDLGGASMRPDRSFRFADGMLVVEADVAAGVAGYAGNAWAEIGISTAAAPTGTIVDPLYAYGIFGGEYSLGCRLQPSREPICALYAPDGTRVWEVSFFQHEAPTVFGGGPFDDLARAWRICDGTDPDLECRDRFRLELTRSSIVLYVRGVRYFEQSGADLLPRELVDGDVYVYFSDWVYRPSANITRFHWDRLAVNP